MWTMKITFKGKQTTHKLEDLSDQKREFSIHWIENYINDELAYILINELDIWDEVEESGWDIDYKVYDSNNNVIDC